MNFLSEQVHAMASRLEASCASALSDYQAFIWAKDHAPALYAEFRRAESQVGDGSDLVAVADYVAAIEDLIYARQKALQSEVAA